MCNFLKQTQELGQEDSYSTDIWYGSCFYDVYQGTAENKKSMLYVLYEI